MFLVGFWHAGVVCKYMSSMFKRRWTWFEIFFIAEFELGAYLCFFSCFVSCWLTCTCNCTFGLWFFKVHPTVQYLPIRTYIALCSLVWKLWYCRCLWSSQASHNKVHFWLHHTAHCVSRNGGKGGVEWDHPQADMHIMAARLGCQSTMVGTRWANSCPGCMNRHRKHYSHLVGGLFLVGKTAWNLSGCLTTESADYCMVVNEWAWLRLRVCVLRLGSVLESELGQKRRYGALKTCMG